LERFKQVICGVKLPRTVQVGCFTISVCVVKNLGVDRALNGEYSHHHLEIRIGSECNAQQAWETYHHELMECINAVYTLNLTHEQISLAAVGLAQSMEAQYV